ncbi:MAG: hypothetical protein GY765_01315 [bacterium]|nr:hypothetical protein [bacterium]
MNGKTSTETVTKNTYAGWSLNTGPAKANALWPGSRWISGQWDGINVKNQWKNDIDARVKCALESFQTARDKREAKPGTTGIFAIPEFYFHCTYGPYPYVKIDGKYPYEYICDALKVGLELFSYADGETWIFCAGSALTCNESDIETFLATPAVQERLDKLNLLVKNLPAANFKVAKGHTHIKALGYMSDRAKASAAEKAINDLMDSYRANPLCIVRNRGIIFNISASGVTGYEYEKQNESTVDLTMGKMTTDASGADRLETGGMITEWLSGYPSISIIGGDKNTDTTPLGARMTLPETGDDALQLGVEICLDHRFKRLRRTVGMTKAFGADADNPPLDIQLIPSGGMQILDYSVAAGIAGGIFNSDGCDPILDEYTSAGKNVINGSGVFKQKTCGVYASSAQLMKEITYSPQYSHKYYSHSQLSFRYGQEKIGGYDNALGTENKMGITFDADNKNPALDAYRSPKIVPITENGDFAIFAAGLGELHIYEVG